MLTEVQKAVSRTVNERREDKEWTDKFVTNEKANEKAAAIALEPLKLVFKGLVRITGG